MKGMGYGHSSGKGGGGSGAKGAARTGGWNEYGSKTNKVGTARFPQSRAAYRKSGGGRGSSRQ
jgi:hypothetical protein